MQWAFDEIRDYLEEHGYTEANVTAALKAMKPERLEGLLLGLDCSITKIERKLFRSFNIKEKKQNDKQANESGRVGQVQLFAFS